MRISPFLAAALLALAVAIPSQSDAIELLFDNDASYDENFVETNLPDYVSRDDAGYLTRFNSSFGAAVAWYNSGATGGVNGDGGTTFSVVRDTYGGITAFSIQADFRILANNSANSYGFYVSAANDQTSAYAVLWRPTNGGPGADIRLFDSNTATAFSSGLGTQRDTEIISDAALPANVWYTAKLTVQTIESDVQFTASLWTTEAIPTQIGPSMVYLDTSSAVTGGGQVGLRLNGTNGATINVDNFMVTVIPEPTTSLLAAIAGVVVLLRRGRRF